MKAYYKARVVHDVQRSRYNVETKTYWFSTWKYQISWYYSQSGKPDQENSLRYAKEKADAFIQETVVYEVP